MTVETDQTADQLDEATVLRVLEMLQEMERDAGAAELSYSDKSQHLSASMMSGASAALNAACGRLVAMYRVSLGLEEV